MPLSLPDIIYHQNAQKNPTVDSSNSMYEIPFVKSPMYFENLSNWQAFIKGCETIIRSCARYKNYIRYLKTEVKLDHCQVLKNIDDKDADIEMHHGPVYTLFDVCAIVVEYFLLRKWKLTTFRIAKQVLDDHEKNRIQVVMLSKTIHQEVTAGNLFIDYHMAWGDMNEFVDKYIDVIRDTEYKTKLNRYLEKCMTKHPEDEELFRLNNKLF